MVQLCNAGETQVVSQGTAEGHGLLQGHVHELPCHAL